MDFQFKKLREAMGKLVGNPNLHESMAKEIESAMTADEQAIKSMMEANGSQGNAQASATTVEAHTGNAPQGTPPTAQTGATEAQASAKPTEPMTLEAVAQQLAALQTEVKTLKTENQTLKADNKELTEFRTAQSPRNVAIQTENTGVPPTTQRVSRTAEKDAIRVAEINRLSEAYPELMSDMV